ncbi:MAG: hypothetical protein WBA10_07555 [Elainellaceae cyanobacterium]
MFDSMPSSPQGSLSSQYWWMLRLFLLQGFFLSLALLAILRVM